MLIRPERLDDLDAIDAVHRGAFPGVDGGEPVEVGLVRALRADVGWLPSLSIVADDPTDGVIGHVVCTVGSIDDDEGLGLGPLGVVPAHQRRGVGHALMHAVLAAAETLDYPVVVLLGDIGYYEQFGFEPASRHGIISPELAWGDHFQARRLGAHATFPQGLFRYAAPFAAL